MARDTSEKYEFELLPPEVEVFKCGFGIYYVSILYLEDYYYYQS